jgi:hypothetical protein
MAMKMRHRLPGVASVVDDQSVAARFQAQTPRYLRGLEQQMPKHSLVFVPSYSDAGDGTTGDDQEMDRSLGGDIVEGGDQLVLVDHLPGYFPGNDFLEQGLAHGWRRKRV